MNDEIFFIHILSLLSFLISLLFLYGAKNKNRYYSFVFFMASYGIFTSEALPGLYWLFLGEEPDYFYLIRPWAWVVGYVAAITYWLVLFFSFKLIKNNSSLVTAVSKQVFFKFPDIIILKNILLIIYALSFLGAVFFISEDERLMGYVAAGITLKEGRREVNLIQPFSSLFFPLSVALIFIFLKYRKEGRMNLLNNIQFYFVLILLFSRVIFGIIQGGRGFIVTAGISLFFIAWVLYGKKIGIAIIIATGLIGAVLSPIIYTYRNDPASYYGLGVTDRIEKILDTYEDTKGTFNQDTELQRIAYRYDGIANGGNLILYSIEDGNIYFNQYLNNLFALIPRRFWPDKPAPGSADGTPSTSSNAITGKISGRPWLVTSVSPSSIAFWQFNFIGLLVIPVIQAFLARVMIKLGSDFNRGELFALCYFLLNPLGSLDASLLQFLQWLLPMMILYWLVDKIFFFNRKYLKRLPT